jgi:hypothetical protein
MLRRRYTVIFILLFLLTFASCATIRPMVVDQTGRKLPSPHYVLQSIEYPIRVLFYYSAIEEVVDSDGTIIANPKYLDFFTIHDVFAEKVKAITMTIEVFNPTGIEYSLYEQTLAKYRKSPETQTGMVLNESKMPFRQFVYELPYGYDIRDIDYNIKVVVNDNDAMMLGPFRYHLIF